MTRVGKWNIKKRAYDPYEPPMGASVYVEDLKTEVQCAHCAEKFVAGEMYTSHLIHVLRSGLGYMVCKECYNQELKHNEK